LADSFQHRRVLLSVKMMVRYLRWIALGAGLLIVLLAVGLCLYTKTETFRRLVREQVIAAINNSIRGAVSLDRIEGSLWGDITLHNVRLRYHDSDIVRIPRLKLSYALLPLLHGRLQIAHAEAAEPWAQIVRDTQGRWNIAEALSSVDTTASQFAVVLKSLALRQGNLDLRLLGTEAEEYRLRSVMLDGRLAVDAKGVDFEAGEITARLQAQPLPELALKGSLAYLDAGSAAAVNVHRLILESAASRLQMAGDVTDFAKPKISAHIAIEKLGAADLARFVPEWPSKQNLTGSIAANGRFDALAVALDIGAAGAKATGHLTLDIAAPAPRYQGAIKLAGVDAQTWLPNGRVAGVVEGSAEVKGVGLALAQLDGTGSFNIRALEAKGWKLGDLRLQTTLRANTAVLNGSLKGALGGADWRGAVTFSKIPRYDFAVAVANLDIKKVSPEGQALGGVVSFKGTIKGAGLALAKMNTQADLEMLPSTVGPVRLRNGALVATLAGGRIRIGRAALATADSSLVVKGDIAVDLAQQGKLDYEFHTENISPWLALAGQKGSGSVAVTGGAQGNIAALRTRGAVKLANLVYGSVALKRGGVDFVLARADKENVPSGTLTARLSGIQAGIELDKLDARVTLTENSHLARIDVKAQDRFERIHTLEASVDYGQPDIVARLSQATLSLPDGPWRLTAPATLTKSGETLVIRKLALQNGEKAAALDGRFAMTGNQSLNLTINKFPLEGLAALLPKQPTMTGRVALQATVSGTAAAPEIAGTINLTDSKIGGQSYTGLVADLSYRQREAKLNVTVRQDAAHTLTAIGRLPLLLSWHEGWRSEITGDMDVRVRSDGLSLAFLNAYATKTVRDLGGEISVDLVARGRPAEPSLSGSFRLSGGKLKALPLNVPINSIAAEGSFDTRMIRMQNLSARANEGTFNGSGVLTLKNYQIDNFKIALAARAWPAIDTRRYHAKIAGNVELDGSPAAPRITGKIDIVEADLRPDLAFLQRSSTAVKRDETITVINKDGRGGPVLAPNRPDNGPWKNDLFKPLVLDLTLRMPGNIRVRHSDASAELRGNIHATKKSGQDLQLAGRSEIVRGWAAFQGRRFEIIRGEIQFVGGGKINPALDILAQYRLPQYTVDALVGGTLEKPSLVLRSSPSLNQAEILALLLFGKTTKNLNSTEQASLKQNALDIAAGFAAANIGSAIAEAIGLNELGDIGLNGGRLGFGHYIGSRTYVTVNQEMAGERGQEVAVEYQLAPDWKIGSSTTSNGSSGIGIIWQKRY
jgi:autotransporter translocation and assembly factor TamB